MESREIIERLDRLTHELVQLKASLIHETRQHNRRKSERAWKDLMQASEEVSSLWSGPSALEEIQSQRTHVSE